MTDQASRLGGATLTRYAEIVHTALIEMRGTTSPRLVLELLCARMMLPDASADAAAVLQRVERLERRMTAGDSANQPTPPAKPAPPPADQAAAPAKPAAGPTKPATARATKPAAKASTVPEPVPDPVPEPVREPAPQPSPPPEPPAEASPAPPRPPGALDAVALRNLWPEVLRVIENSSRTIRALLETSQVVEAGDNAVTLAVAPSLAKRLAEERNVAAIAEALANVVGGTWRVVIAAGAGGPAAANGATAARPGPVEPAPEADPRDDVDYEPTAPAAAAPVDPDAEAMRLLREQLGARPLDS
jgi:DNA polymerase-3 subunit gamma/tau